MGSWFMMCTVLMPFLCLLWLCLQVEFPVLPGDRLLLRLAEVDVRNGFYRLYVHDRLDSAAPPPGVIDEEEDEEQQQLEAVDTELLEAEHTVEEAQEMTAQAAVDPKSAREPLPPPAISWRSNPVNQHVTPGTAVHDTDMILTGGSSSSNGSSSEAHHAVAPGAHQPSLQLRLDTSGTESVFSCTWE
jgi:hypothetical protein